MFDFFVFLAEPKRVLLAQLFYAIFELSILVFELGNNKLEFIVWSVHPAVLFGVAHVSGCLFVSAGLRVPDFLPLACFIA